MEQMQNIEASTADLKPVAANVTMPAARIVNRNGMIAELCQRNRMILRKGDAARIAEATAPDAGENQIIAAARTLGIGAGAAGGRGGSQSGHRGKAQRQATKNRWRKAFAAALDRAGFGNAPPTTYEHLVSGLDRIDVPEDAKVDEMALPLVAGLRAKKERDERIARMRPIAQRRHLHLVDDATLANLDLHATLRSHGEDAVVAVLRRLHESEVRKRLAWVGITSLQELEGRIREEDGNVANAIATIAGPMKLTYLRAATAAATGLGADEEQAKVFAEAATELRARQANEAAEAKRKELEEKRRHEAWHRSLLGIADVRARIGATATEVRRWIDEGRIPTAAKARFVKWGKTLHTTLHDPAAVETAKLNASVWRAEWAEAKKARRKQTADGADAKRRRRRAALLRSAMADATLGPTGDTIDAPIGSIEIAIAGTATTLDLTGPWTERLPWPSAVQEAAGATPLKGKGRAAAVAAIKGHADAGVAETRRRLQADADSWALQTSTVLDGYPEDERPAFRTQLDAALRRCLPRGEGTTDDPAATLRAKLVQASAIAVTAHARDARQRTLKRDSGLSDYAALFPLARSIRRRITLRIGPTNSGKTHDAMERLAAAENGCYLAPLRLMALEAAERMNARGVPTDMLTGEEAIEADDATHVASTIEMIDTGIRYDVAVIDEMQMVADRERGWAWTQAAVGIAADEVVMTGSADALPYVVRIAQMTGDDLEVIAHERLVPLEAMNRTLTFLDVEEGDALIAFSRADVHRLRTVLGERMPVATVYGALSPEVRRNEARRFREGEAKVLVATDAIAMGLNMPIKRVVFTALDKFDGTRRRELTESEIRQIAGRAGRFGFEERGHVAVLAGLSPARVTKALASQPTPPDDLRLPVMPPWRAIDTTARSADTDRLPQILEIIRGTLLEDDPNIKAGSYDDAIAMARLVDKSRLPLRTRHRYVGCPVDHRDESAIAEVRSWAAGHGTGKPVRAPAFARLSTAPDTDDELGSCEAAVKRLTTYLWLAMRWPETYLEKEQASTERARLNGLIEGALRRKALARTCRDCGGRLSKGHRFPICDSCHQNRFNRYDDY